MALLKRTTMKERSLEELLKISDRISADITDVLNKEKLTYIEGMTVLSSSIAAILDAVAEEGKEDKRLLRMNFGIALLK